MQPILAGPCAMRPWRKGDERALATAANHRAISLTLRDRFPHPYTLADAETWVALNLADPDPVNLAIEVDGEVTGGIGLVRQSDVHRISAELGYWLTPACWGRGIMTAAVTGFTEWAFATTDLERVYAVTFESNPASARVLEKSGYTLEGLLRNSVLKAGRLMDSRLYARLRT